MHPERVISNLPGARAAVLDLLKREGPISSEILAGRLDVTTMAVRQHLQVLEQEGFALSVAPANGRGRPAKLWRATAKADSHFPDSHSALAADLIRQMRATFGEEGLDRLLMRRTADQENTYRVRIEGEYSIEAKLEALVLIRSEEGYMADLRRGPESNCWLFVENHCPICSAARSCAGLCREELSLFQRLLGPRVRVERISHILAGSGRCAYRVTALP